MTSPSAMFKRLGAPLHNVQWSWGAVRADGSVVLRVWQDETRKIEDGRRLIRLVNHRAYQGSETNLGYSERLAHLDRLRAGAAGFVVICRAEDVNSRPRSIASFDAREVIRLGEIVVLDGDEWGELLERIPIKSLQFSSDPS